MFKFKNKKLKIYRSYNVDDGYGKIEKVKKISIEKFLEKGRNKKTDINYGFISTIYNGITYPVYDLDKQDKYELFLKEHDKDNYVIFRSSSSLPDNSMTANNQSETNHYWAIVDDGVKHIKKYDNLNWHKINDENYVYYCKANNSCFLRFTYSTIKRKPIRIKSKKNISNNFKEFIEKFESLINNEGLELSALLFDNVNLIKTYNRKQKFSKITNTEIKKDL